MSPRNELLKVQVKLNEANLSMKRAKMQSDCRKWLYVI